MYNFISLCGYSLKMNMVLKYKAMKNVIFNVMKTAFHLFMGYSLEMPHVIEPRDTTGRFLIPRPYPGVFESPR